MAFLPDLTRRQLRPEWMDQPDLDVVAHQNALDGLARINLLSRSAGLLWPGLAALARTTGPVRALDVATGSGDVPVRLWHKARRAGLPLTIDGCDRSPVAVAQAQRRAVASGADVSFFTADALTDDVPAGYDAVVCSLFLHHLDEPEAVRFLTKLRDTAKRLVLINDLRRCRAGLVLAHIGTRLLSRSPVVHVDGPRSVEGAFTLEEARVLAERAGLHGARVERRWPCRFLLTWRRP